MTEREKIEREIILDILAESSKWRVTEDDQDVDCIRMEVMDRAKRLLLGADTVDENGYAQTHEVQVQAEPAPEHDIDVSLVQAIEASRLNEHLEEKKKQKQYTEAKNSWKNERVRVFIDGRPVWKLRDQCRQVPRDNSKGGLPWTWHWDDPGKPKEPFPVAELNSSNQLFPVDEKQEQIDACWAEHDRA